MSGGMIGSPTGTMSSSPNSITSGSPTTAIGPNTTLGTAVGPGLNGSAANPNPALPESTLNPPIGGTGSTAGTLGSGSVLGGRSTGSLNNGSPSTGLGTPGCIAGSSCIGGPASGTLR
jgi:hypothetical protein